MSFLARRRAGSTEPAKDQVPPDPASPGRARWRSGLTRAATVLAAGLVLLALVAPSELPAAPLGAYLRIPVEGLVGAALLLALPGRARLVAAGITGAALGMLTLLKITDRGFMAVLARPFDPVVDWPLLSAGVGFLTESVGQVGAIGTVVAAVVLAVLVLAIMVGSVIQLGRVLGRHRTRAGATVAVLTAGWLACALLAVQVVPGVPVAASSHDRLLQLARSLQDERAFAGELTVDAFADVPGDQLLTALAGKDVVITFVESYGRDAIEDPRYAAEVGAVLDAGTSRLAGAGFATQSGFLTAPTTGGASWLSHATLLAGLRIDNQRRHQTLMASDRLTLNAAFGRAGWRAVALMPAILEDWPEAAFFGYDRYYDSQTLGYQGERMNWGRMPDQYTMAALERFERNRHNRKPVMAEIALVSSHAPWAPRPPIVAWEQVGDGSIFQEPVGGPAEAVLRNPERMRTAYRDAVSYSLTTVISYVETYGDDDLVFIFLGDHQPAPVITGQDASHDVPISIVARDPAVLDRIADWGWQDGLRPTPEAPVWPMESFRDQFLTAFSPDLPGTIGPG